MLVLQLVSSFNSKDPSFKMDLQFLGLEMRCIQGDAEFACVVDNLNSKNEFPEKPNLSCSGSNIQIVP